MTASDRPLAPPTSGAALPRWMPLLVVAFAWLAQGVVLRNGWVSDDAILIRDGKTVARGWAAVPDLMTGTWGRGDGIERGLYRPLVGASLAIEAALHGGVANPFLFHLLNLCLHGVAAVLVLAVGNRLLPGRPIVTSAAALLFAVHPLHTGTVSWIVARGDLMATVFALAAVLVWTRPRGLDVAAAALAGLCYLLALLSKESALPLPAILLLVDAAARREGVRTAVRRRWHGYVALALAGGVWLALRANAGGFAALSANAPLASRPLLERVYIAAGSLVRMAWKIAVPVGLTGDASNDPVLVRGAPVTAAYILAAVVVTIGALVLAARARQGRGGLVSFCLAAFALLALPVIQLIPIGAVFEDRFAYLPSVALLPIAGLAAERILSVGARRIALAAAFTVLVALSLASWSVAADWRDEEAFNRALLADDPGHMKATDRLATHLLHEARRAKAVSETLPLPSGEARRQALLERHRAQVVEAVDLLEKASGLPAGRRSQAIQLGLADAYANLPDPRLDEAQRAYLRWLELKRVLEGDRRVRIAEVASPARVAREDRREVVRVYEALARTSTLLHVDDRAARARFLDAASRWSPESFDLARRTATAWIEAQEFSRALSHLDRAVALAEADPRIPPDERSWAIETRAEVRTKTQPGGDAFARAEEASRKPNHQKEALALYHDALRAEPDLIDAYFEIAKIHGSSMGNLKAAFETLDAATTALDGLRAPPDDPRRERVASLRATYERRRDEVEDPIIETIDAARFAASKHDLGLARKTLADARAALDAGRAPADDPRRAEIDELDAQYAKEQAEIDAGMR